MSPESDSELPSKIAYLPTFNPAPKSTVTKGADAEASDAKSVDNKDDSPSASESAKTKNKAAAAPKSDFYVTATDPQTQVDSKKGGFFSFLGSTPAKPQKPTPVIEMASKAPAKPVV
jgi:hypothetical protein